LSSDQSRSEGASHRPDENEAIYGMPFIPELLSAAGALAGGLPVRQRIASESTGGIQKTALSNAQQNCDEPSHQFRFIFIRPASHS
jgi:hypothetical protein